MKRRLIAAVLVLACLLTGCTTWNSGSHISVKPHRARPEESNSDQVSVRNYVELRTALVNFVENGIQKAVINISGLEESQIVSSMDVAIGYILGQHPIGAYAVKDIQYEIGTNSGRVAAAINIEYIHGLSEIRRIQKVKTVEEAKALVEKALNEMSLGVVIQIEESWSEDFSMVVEDYVFHHPDLVMEKPEVLVQAYPDLSADDKIVELKFTYQTSREKLRVMQAQVKLVFDSAALYVSGDAEEHEKFTQLYSFLMERYHYNISTSITPAYSLLRHGVGDSEAFARVYASMCQRAGLECEVISGTRDGEAWYWNLVYDEGAYYHVDLLRSAASGGFQEHSDSAMEGYVWDYSSVPPCTTSGEHFMELEPLVTDEEETEPETGEGAPEEAAEAEEESAAAGSEPIQPEEEKNA